MLDLLSFTMILPLVGAVGILLLSGLVSTLGRKRGYLRVLIGLFPIAMVVLASIIVLSSGGRGRLALSSLYPSVLVESPVELRWDSMLWPLGLGLSVGSGCLLLGEAARRERSPHLIPVVLGLLAAGLASLWSGNPLTTIICWAFYDMLLALGWVAAGGDRQEAVRGLVVGLGSGLLLWAGVVATGGGVGSVGWELLPPGGSKMVLWMAAGMVRIGAYPLHVWIPRDHPLLSPAAVVFLLSPLLGWGLWIRLASVGGGGLSVGVWMVIPALLTVLGGGILAWTENAVSRSRRWMSMTFNGLVLLGTVMGHSPGGGMESSTPTTGVAMMTLGALGWTLSTTLLFMGGGIERRGGRYWIGWVWAAPSLVGALSLAGVPLTAGFAGVSSALAEAADAHVWVLAVGAFLGHLLLCASAVRWLLASDPVELDGRGLLGPVAHGTGLGGIAIAVVVCGTLPALFMSGGEVSAALNRQTLLTGLPLVGWAMWAVGLVAGVGLGLMDGRFRPRVSLWLDVVHDVVVLEWAYSLIAGAAQQGLGLIRVVDGILGGRASMLWSCVFLLIVVLFLGR